MDVRTIVARTLGRLAYAMLDVALPRTCIVTEAPLSECTEQLIPGIADGVIEVLPPAPFPNELLAGLARHHDATMLLVDEVHSMWEASDEVMKIVHAVKYQGRKILACDVGKALGRLLQDRMVTGDILVPVPIHTARRRERGYNQAELLGSGIAQVLDIPLRTDVLRRGRYTGTQTALGAAARRTNLEGSIVAHNNVPLHRCTVILVDDVLTTGTTLNTCAWALKQAGAQTVIAATVAAA